MKSNSIILFVFLLLAVTSCATTNRFDNENRDYPLINEVLKYSNDEIEATLSFPKDRRYLVLTIENKTNHHLKLLTDLSSYTSPINETVKLISGGTRFSKTGDVLPNDLIPPKSKYINTFAASNMITYGRRGWSVTEWVPIYLNEFQFSFSYNSNGEEKYFGFKKTDGEFTFVGDIFVKDYYWDFLFFINVDFDKEKIADIVWPKEALYELAYKQAVAKYGNNIKLVNLRYKQRWNPLSFVMVFGMVGYVEKSTLHVDVVKEISNPNN